MIYSIFKLIAKKIINFIKTLKLAKKNVIIERNVSFSRSKFAKYIKIFENTHINDSFIDSFSYVSKDCILNNVQIGKFSSIGPCTEVVYGTHPLEFISTHPVFYSAGKQSGISFTSEQLFEEYKYVEHTKRSCIIGNDVWIGYGVKIIEGIKIGDGAVVLTGAVVTKDVEPYTIVGGVPAKFIKYRFSEEEIFKLKDFKWWDKDIIWIKENHKIFTNKNLFFEKIGEINETN